ncbi:putative nucleic-acid-binding protein, contains PIN domain [Hoeflea sp. IMCC20628]|uniref:PIN domain-containing protein n=1 Tax=Hoeflea sp. IMCC20628 TaxID=1620421 RepID=UPI00063AF4D0|nr:type II toxin-antitoxin system VapC family toxin [Hoeflea sp. IMCC20628]AKH99161.1 putative nucleic-acid-binding protein, contains PIN domain [Hoeflea sp. IMCC20628]
MIGIDTNIIVRLLTRDDKTQFDAAVELVKASDADRPLFVNPMVIVETIWVLERVYKTDRETARSHVAGLLDTVEIKVPEMLHMKNWAEWLHSPHPDFSDVVIAGINRENGCEKTMTFDKKAAASVPGMELLS